MKRLLDLGVDVNFADESNMDMPALSVAAYFGFKDVAEQSNNSHAVQDYSCSLLELRSYLFLVYLNNF